MSQLGIPTEPRRFLLATRGDAFVIGVAVGGIWRGWGT